MYASSSTVTTTTIVVTPPQVIPPQDTPPLFTPDDRRSGYRSSKKPPTVSLEPSAASVVEKTNVPPHALSRSNAALAIPRPGPTQAQDDPRLSAKFYDDAMLLLGTGQHEPVLESTMVLIDRFRQQGGNAPHPGVYLAVAEAHLQQGDWHWHEAIEMARAAELVCMEGDAMWRTRARDIVLRAFLQSGTSFQIRRELSRDWKAFGILVNRPERDYAAMGNLILLAPDICPMLKVMAVWQPEYDLNRPCLKVLKWAREASCVPPIELAEAWAYMSSKEEDPTRKKAMQDRAFQALQRVDPNVRNNHSRLFCGLMKSLEGDPRLARYMQVHRLGPYAASA